MRVIIVAAGHGKRLRPITDDRPKCMVPVAGRTLLDWQMSAIEAHGLGRPVVVGGHCESVLPRDRVDVRLNPAHATTNMVRSLFCAEQDFGDGFVLAYGDIAYAPRVLGRLLESAAPISVVVDRDWRRYWEQRFDDPLADAESLRLDGDRIVSIGQRETDIDRIQAQYIGLLKFSREGVDTLRRAYARAAEDECAGGTPFGSGRTLDMLYMTDLLQGITSLGGTLTAVPVDGGWVEVDSHRDLAVAESLIAEGRLRG